MVEDEAHDAALVEHALKDGGFDFTFKRVDTEEGFLKEIQSFHPSVILSDHGLPAFDGFAALAIAQRKVPDVPFIFVTAFAEEVVRVRALDAGAIGFLTKPFDKDTLVRCLEKALGAQ